MYVALLTLLAPALATAIPAPHLYPEVFDRSASAAPSSISINGITYGGTGCPQGTLNASISDDGKILPLVFGDDFSASVGPNVAITESRKFCQINLDIDFSAGFQYAVYSADYIGYADLDSGVQASITALYYFSGQTAQVITEAEINGPFTGYYDKHDDIAIATWSPCGSQGLLNINSQIALTSSSDSQSGIVSTEKIKASFVHQLYIKWRSC